MVRHFYIMEYLTGKKSNLMNYAEVQKSLGRTVAFPVNVLIKNNNGKQVTVIDNRPLKD